MNQEPVGDELLSAWVDGELTPQQRVRVQAWLDSHPQDRARVAAWAADRQALAHLFRLLPGQAVPVPLQEQVWRQTGPRPMARWAMAAAAAGLLVAGALLGGGAAWQLQQQRLAALQDQLRTQAAGGNAQGWAQRAVFAHQVYVVEPRHAVEVKAQEEHLARWLTRRIQIPVKLFDLQGQGFALVGGRLLPDGPGKSAQLMYEDAQKRRVTVYLRKPEKGMDVAFRYQQQGQLGMFYWTEEGAGYALVGELPRPTLLALAQAIYEQHPGALPPAPDPAAASPTPAPPAPAPSVAPRPSHRS